MYLIKWYGQSGRQEGEREFSALDTAMSHAREMMVRGFSVVATPIGSIN